MAGIKERLIQVVLRGKDLLSPEAKKGREALNNLRDAGAELRKELENAESQSTLAKSLISLEKDSKRAENEVERTREKVEALTKALDTESSSKGLEKSLEIAAKEARAAERNLSKLKQETIDYTARAKAAGIDTSKLADEEKRLSSEVSKAKKSVVDNTKATKDLERKQRAAARAAAEQAARTTSLGNALRSAEKKVLGYAAAYISLKAATNLAGKGLDLIKSGIQKVIGLGDDAEKSKIQLEGLMGSVAGGEQATAWIEEFADKTGQRINTVIDSFADLKAYGLDPMDGSMQAILDKNAQLGGNAETLKGIALGVGQMWAKEKIVQEEVNQLRERGVQVFDLLSKAMNKNVGELQDMAAAGKLGRDEIRLLIDEMGKSADGQAARALDTLSGKWNVLLNQFQKFGESVASHGAMDVVKEKLQGVLDKIIELKDDGSLANLAEALSDVFVQGLEEVDRFIGGLGEVDFKQLATDSTEWLKSFGSQLDDAKLRVKYFFAPFITGFNVVHTGFLTLAMFALSVFDTIAAGVQRTASIMPDVFGGAKLEKAAYDARAVARGMFDGLVDDVLQNNKDIANAWNVASEDFEDNKKKEAAAARAAEKEKRRAIKETEQAVEEMLAKEVEAGEERRKAAIDGKRAIEDMADAMQLIDSTQSVAELEKMRKSLLKAFQEGRISQQEFEQSTGSLNGKIRELGKAGKNGAKDLSSISGVLNAIDKAANDLDVSAARTALNKLYREGKINADELKKAQEALNVKVAELKPAAEIAASSFKQSQEEQRAELSKTLEEQRRASGEAMEQSRRVGEVAEEQAVSIKNFFDEVLSRARDPLREMSEEALAAFDALQGLPGATPKMDYASVEGLTEALKEARNELNGIRVEQGLAGSLANGFTRWATKTLELSKQVQVAYIQEKLAMQDLIQQYEKGAIGAEKFAKTADEMRKNAELLGEADLSALTGAIDAAKSKMDQLAQSTRSTLQSLNDELLQLKGTQEEIEAAKMQSRKDDLRQQLVVAQKDGDAETVRNLRQALNTLAEIEAEKERQLRNQRAEEAKAQPVQQQPAKVIQLQAAGQSVSVGINSDSDELSLLRILEQAGMRTVR